MDITGVEICLVCFSAMKETLETFKLRGVNLKDTQAIQTNQLDLQKAFKQEKADDSNTMHNSRRKKMEQKTWLKCMIVTDKPDFKCFEYKKWKLPFLSVLICWKFEYKQSWLPNYLIWILLYYTPAILLHVQLRTTLKGKHSGRLDCTQTNKFFLI